MKISKGVITKKKSDEVMATKMRGDIKLVTLRISKGLQGTLIVMTTEVLSRGEVEMISLSREEKVAEPEETTSGNK